MSYFEDMFDAWMDSDMEESFDDFALNAENLNEHQLKVIEKEKDQLKKG